MAYAAKSATMCLFTTTLYTLVLEQWSPVSDSIRLVHFEYIICIECIECTLYTTHIFYMDLPALWLERMERSTVACVQVSQLLRSGNDEQGFEHGK